MASALAWPGPSFVTSVALLFVIGIVHRALRVYLRVAVTSDLFALAIKASLREGIDRSPQRQKDGNIAVMESVEEGGRAVVDVALPLLADGIASFLAVALIVRALTSAGVRSIFGLALVAAFALVLLRTLTLRSARRSYDAHVAVFEDVEDAIDGRAEIIASGHRTRFIDRAQADLERWRSATARTDGLVGAVGRAPFLLVAFVVGASLLLNRTGFDARIVADAILVFGIAPSVIGLIRGVHELSKANASLGPLLALMAAPLENPSRMLHSSGSITWDEVTLAYGSRRVLQGVRAVADPGEIVVLSGPNGSGKSSLIHTTMGLLSPVAGRLLIGGRDLSDLDRDHWRRTIRYLSQRPYLLPRRPIRATLSFPFDEPNDDAALKVLGRVGLRAFGQEKLSTPADCLSAGERQRIALARVLLRDGDVYLLDEPDANLDAAGVKMVAEILRELADAGKIVVVAAHTPELIAVADRVVHLENGRVTSIEERSKGTPTSQKRKAAES